MAGLRICRIAFLLLLGCFVWLGTASLAQAQTGADDVDLEFQLHLLVASNAAATDGAKLSAPLEGVARDLRPLLPFTNYRLGATFLSRVKNSKPISVKGVGRTLLTTPMLEASVNPTFYEISAASVSLKDDAAGRDVVQLSAFRFGLRIPLQGISNKDEASGVMYEGVGITTDVTMREGEPVVVGTLDAGRPNETLVLVIVAKRAR